MIETADGWHLARDHLATASVGNGEGKSALRARVEAEIPELRGLIRVGSRRCGVLMPRGKNSGVNSS